VNSSHLSGAPLTHTALGSDKTPLVSLHRALAAISEVLAALMCVLTERGFLFKSCQLTKSNALCNAHTHEKSRNDTQAQFGPLPLFQFTSSMSRASLTISHGVPYLVADIVSKSISGSVRAVGALTSFDAQHSTAVIEHAGAQLTVSTMLLPDFCCQVDSLAEFIGEMQVRVHMFMTGYRS
jgi:Telomere-capping, CST complex subunit